MSEAANSTDFAAMFEQSLNKGDNYIAQGDRVKGTVIQVTAKNVFVDLGLKSEGILDIKDVTDSQGKVKVKVGDQIDAINMGTGDGYFKLQLRISASEVDTNVQDAFEAKIPIEGKVTGENKGGYTVEISKSQAFCPFSQMDVRGVKKEHSEYIGKTFSFLITEYAEDGGRCVVSRRRLLEEEEAKMRDYLKSMLNVGDVREGTVVNVMPFGAFVDLGGLQGLVPGSELSWNRGVKVEDAVKVGDVVTVKIIGLDWGDGESRERITLSIKQTTKNLWEKIAEGDTTYAPGTKHRGKVVRIADFGAFVELEPGVDGLAHISQLGQESRVEKVEDVCKVGDEVEVTVLGIDPERRRISICFGDPKVKEEKPAELSHEQEAEIVAATMGERLTGEVESLKPFGAFIKLPNGQTGLLHISRCGIEERGPAGSRELYRRFPLHAKVEVIVQEINGDRISLTLPEVVEAEIERQTVNNFKDEGEGAGDFGSIGDAFSGLKL